MQRMVLRGVALAVFLTLDAAGASYAGSPGALQSANENPIVVGEDVVWPLNVTSTIDVLANDSDAEGGALTVELIGQPPGASATVNGGEISVTPAPGMSGPTHVEYRVSDQDGGSAVGRVRVIFGSMPPIFYRHYDSVTRTDGIRRYDYFSQQTLTTPGASSVDRLSGFITSADATKMVYTTIRPVPPFPRRLYLKDLTDDSAPVQEIETGGGMRVDVIAISADGNHIAYEDRYVHASRPGQPITIAPGAQRPHFSNDGHYLFYVTVSPSGARAIHRAEIDPVLGPINPVQITGTYPAGQGLGVDYALTPDETQVVSIGAIYEPAFGTTKQYLYVSPVNGPVNDVRLHPQFSTTNDSVTLPVVTPDSRYAPYLATLAGAAGLYSTDLQSPGTATVMALNPNAYTRVSDYASSGDSTTVFYSRVENDHKWSWYYTSFAQPGASTQFMPLGPSQTQINRIYPAPDGSHTVFTIADAVYSTTAPYTSATTLLPTGGSSSWAEGSYAPDSSMIVVSRQSEVSRIYILNPKAPGWVGRADPGNANDNTSCVMFPGQRCP